MSLWSVGEDMTARWMRELYEGTLPRGYSTAEAVRQADLALLRRQREAGRSTHPFFWAALVGAGDWV